LLEFGGQAISLVKCPMLGTLKTKRPILYRIVVIPLTSVHNHMPAELKARFGGMASTSGDLRERYSAIDLETTRVLAEAGATVMDCNLSE